MYQNMEHYLTFCTVHAQVKAQSTHEQNIAVNFKKLDRGPSRGSSPPLTFKPTRVRPN